MNDFFGLPGASGRGSSFGTRLLIALALVLTLPSCTRPGVKIAAGDRLYQLTDLTFLVERRETLFELLENSDAESFFSGEPDGKTLIRVEVSFPLD